MAQDLNSGLLWTNPASSQGRTWTRGLRISSSALEDLNSRQPRTNPATGLQVRRFNHSATLPPSLLPMLRSDELLKAALTLWTKNLSPIKIFSLKRLLFGWKCNNYNRRQIAETLSSNRETSKTKQSTPLPFLLSWCWFSINFFFKNPKCLNYCNKKWYHEKLLLNSFDLNCHRTLALRSLKKNYFSWLNQLLQEWNDYFVELFLLTLIKFSFRAETKKANC